MDKLRAVGDMTFKGAKGAHSITCFLETISPACRADRPNTMKAAGRAGGLSGVADLWFTGHKSLCSLPPT
ncbi:MAG: hypothetical protein WC091_02265 [Sulfuricellaceae bacterium]